MDYLSTMLHPQGLPHKFLLSSENPDQFNALYGDLVRDHRPVGVVERHMVDRIAMGLWRLRRIRYFDDHDGRLFCGLLDSVGRATQLLNKLQKDRAKQPRKAEVIPFPHAKVRVEPKPIGIRPRVRSPRPEDGSV